MCTRRVSYHCTGRLRQVNKKLKINIYRALRLVVVCWALFLFVVVGIVAVLMHARASTNGSFVALDATTLPLTVTATAVATATPTATAVATATPTATATAAPTAAPTKAPTAAPTKAPPAVPTKAPPAAGAVPGPQAPLPANTPTAIAATATATAMPTAVATSAATTTTSSATTIGVAPTGATSTVPATNGIINSMLVSGGIVLLVLLVGSGTMGLLVLRRKGVLAVTPGGTVAAGQSAPWTMRNNSKVVPAIATPSAAFASAVTMANNMPRIPASVPIHVNQSSPLSYMAASAQTYMPSNLHPMTSPMPAQLISKDGAHARALTSDMSPLSLDMLDLPQEARQENDVSAASTSGLSLIPATLPSELEPTDPAIRVTTIPLAPAQQDSVQLPAVSDDPMLEAIMRQAQMGLYVLPDKAPKESGESVAEK